MKNREVIHMDNFKPRDYQRDFVIAMESGGYKKSVVVWPRRAGKDVCSWNLLIRAAVRNVGSYIYCLPSFSMCRRVLLNSKLHNGSSFMDFIPKKLIASFNKQEMKIELINGSIIIMIGSDNAKERVVGMAAKGLVISEAALANPEGISYLQPMITASDGFLIIISTPRSKNRFWELYTTALQSKDWFVSKLTVDDTKHVPLERIEADIKAGIMSRELAQQEWWTSFSSQNQGAYYGKYVDVMLKNDQYTVVPFEPSLQTYCFMDIGVNDMFVLLFVQVTSLTIRIFDYYENHSEGLEHYINIIKGKGYGTPILYAPHDIRVRELTTGISRLEKLQSFGLEVNVVAGLSINDGIEAVRTILPKTYIDNRKCDKLIKAIENYTKEYDEGKQVYKDKPKHDKYCFLGHHKVLTVKGEVPISEIEVGDVVITPFGERKVLKTHKRRTRKLLDITIKKSFFSDPVILTTTDRHNIFTNRGFVNAKSLRMKDILEPYKNLRIFLWKGLQKTESEDIGFKDFVALKKYTGYILGVKWYRKLITIIQLFFTNLIAGLSNFYYWLFGFNTVENINRYTAPTFQYVYDLTIEVDHVYYIDGYLVSNSHANDALRYLAVSHKKLGIGTSAEELDERYANAVYGKSNKLPHIFR